MKSLFFVICAAVIACGFCQEGVEYPPSSFRSAETIAVTVLSNGHPLSGVPVSLLQSDVFKKQINEGIDGFTADEFSALNTNQKTNVMGNVFLYYWADGSHSLESRIFPISGEIKFKIGNKLYTYDLTEHSDVFDGVARVAHDTVPIYILEISRYDKTELPKK